MTEAALKTNQERANAEKNGDAAEGTNAQEQDASAVNGDTLGAQATDHLLGEALAAETQTDSKGWFEWGAHSA